MASLAFGIATLALLTAWIIGLLGDPATPYESMHLTSTNGLFQPPSCYDYLARQHFDASIFKYQSCEYVGGQLQSWEATYSVEGPRAEEALGILKRTTDHPELGFACCGWEPQMGGYGSLNAGHEFPLRIQMHSGESLVKDRNKWHTIPTFNVTVTLDSTEP